MALLTSQIIRISRGGLQLLPLRFASSQPPPNIFTNVVEKDGVREIILNHPKTRNSLSMEMMASILENITKNQDDINLRCIILSSTGPVWSAGHNLKDLASHSEKEYPKTVFAKCNEIIFAILNSPVPVIAKVNGLAAAAGLQVVSSCDIAICSDSSSFSTPGANFGIFCHNPGVAISRSVSKMTSSYMLFTGLPINAQVALSAGLVSKVVPQEKLDHEIEIICGAIKSKSRAVLTIGKTFFYEQLNLDTKGAFIRGADVMSDNVKLKDGQEGVQSFYEKRPPMWSHKMEN